MVKHVPGFTGQGWHTNETMLVVKWIFTHDDVLRKILALARQYPDNEHTIADTLHEQLVPKSELTKILGKGGEPAKVDWLEIAHEIIERRHDPARLSAVMPGEKEFPGRAEINVGQTPRGASSMFTAHRVDDTLRGLAHALERVQAIEKCSNPAERRYQARHLTNHLSYCLDQMHALAENLRSNYPAEAKELAAVKDTIGLAKAVNQAAKTATTAHLTETALHELTHGKRHSMLLTGASPDKTWAFNFDHAQKHVHGAHEHVVKLAQHFLDNYPEEGRWLKMLEKLASPAEPDSGSAHRSYVKAAAPAAWPSGKAYKDSFLSPPRDMPNNATVISAPGTGKPQYLYGQMKQEPVQTVSPSPPLPSGVSLPTPEQLRAFGDQLGKIADDEDHHLRGAQMHLESAAEKMPNNPVSALASLRSAQMAIQEAWRESVARAKPRIAYVYSANTPPAEQSSQQQVWAQAQARFGKMQSAASKIATFIDRVRRAYFGRAGMTDHTAGGGLSGYPNARLSSVEPYERTEQGRQELVHAYDRDAWQRGQQIWEQRGEAAWRKHLKKRGFSKPDIDLLTMEQHREKEAVQHVESAPLGSHEHAEELREIARRGELAAGRNAISLQVGRAGTETEAAEHFAAGDKMPVGQMPPHIRALHRAAEMIDKKQPSLARVHAAAIRAGAKYEAHMRPDYAAELRGAASKLEKLPSGTGLASTSAKKSLDEAAREARTARLSSVRAYERTDRGRREEVRPYSREAWQHGQQVWEQRGESRWRALAKHWRDRDADADAALQKRFDALGFNARKVYRDRVGSGLHPRDAMDAAEDQQRRDIAEGQRQEARDRRTMRQSSGPPALSPSKIQQLT